MADLEETAPLVSTTPIRTSEPRVVRMRGRSMDMTKMKGLLRSPSSNSSRGSQCGGEDHNPKLLRTNSSREGRSSGLENGNQAKGDESREPDAAGNGSAHGGSDLSSRDERSEGDSLLSDTGGMSLVSVAEHASGDPILSELRKNSALWMRSASGSSPLPVSASTEAAMSASLSSLSKSSSAGGQKSVGGREGSEARGGGLGISEKLGGSGKRGFELRLFHIVLLLLLLLGAWAYSEHRSEGKLKAQVSALKAMLHCTALKTNQLASMADANDRDAAALSSGSEQCDLDSLQMQLEEDGSHVLPSTLRLIALIFSVISLVTPFVLWEFADTIYDFVQRRKRRNGPEGVPADHTRLSKRIAYQLDIWFSLHPWVKAVALLLATLFLITIGGFALFSVGSDELHLPDAMWQSWTYVADAGNHADSEGFSARVVSVSISIGGMLIFALMVGLVSESISEKVDSLRKGKSEVIEKDHTLILGWSEKLASVMKQLATANESAGGGVVVILAEREKEEMESEISKMEFDFKGTQVICRSGSPLVLPDLRKVSVTTARSIIVLAEAEKADAADARALRIVLSLTGVRDELRGHVVAELLDVDNVDLVKMVGGSILETVVAHDVIGRLMIQCARQPGLAQVYEVLLGFENCEFYVKQWPQLSGKTFADAFISFPDAIPIGVKIASDNGRICLNPDDDYVIQAEDSILVIAEDDDSYEPGALPLVPRQQLPDVIIPPKIPEKILFVGWRRDMDDMITVLESFLAPGSELWVFSDVPIEEREARLLDGGLNPGDLSNISLVHRLGSAILRRHLEALPLEAFDSILILADEELEGSVIDSDSRSLATLLLIRDIQSKRIPSDDEYASPSTSMKRAASTGAGWLRQMHQATQQSIVISEILDSRTRSLVSVSKISDYVLSNELVSMALAMVAEDREINRVLEELFQEEGNELYIRPAELYLNDGDELSFFEVMARGRQRNEVIIGYRLSTDDEPIVNPSNKSEKRRWSELDSFVVLSMEE